MVMVRNGDRLMTHFLKAFCLVLLAVGAAQAQTVQGSIMREGTGEPIVGAQISLTVPGITSALDTMMNLAAAYGMPPSALVEIRQMITALMQASPAKIQQEINEAKSEGAPPEYVAILSQMLTSKAGAPGFPKNAVSDNSGRYAFSDVPPGNYLITAEREGFFGTSAKGTNARSTTVALPIAVSERQPPPDVTLRMTAGGRIQGRVRDGAGRPLPNLNVQAFTQAYQNGTPVLQTVAKQKTDDRGEFRLFWLEPGDYVVAAEPNVIPNPGAISGDITVLTYYPGNESYLDSVRVPVKPGEEVNGMDITMRVAPTVRIRGRIAGLPAAPATLADDGIYTTLKLIALLNPIPFNEADEFRSTPSLVSTRSGTFEIPGVRPGSYEVVLRATLPRPPGTARTTTLWGRVAVEVGNSDIEGLVLAMQPDLAIRGKVTMQGGASGPQRDPVMVGLQPDGISAQMDNDGGEPAPVAPDGAFSFPSIALGDYKVRVFGIPSNAYVADIRQEGASIFAAGLRISEKPPEPIEVTIGLDGGTVEGVTFTADQKIAPSTTVVLVPTTATERLNGERYKVVTTDAQGRFKITGIRPGPHKVFAWQTLPMGAYQNSAFLERFEAQGVAVEVKPAAAGNVRVVVIQN